jgi:hypothetical protein
MDHVTRDAREISRACLDSEETFFWAGVFVVLTIRQPFYGVAHQMRDVRKNGAASRYLFGWKRDAFRYLAQHKASLQSSAKAFQAGQISLDSLILAYLAIPGMGIVKASFFAQLTVCDGACLDSHNLKALGLNAAAFKTPKTLTVGTIAKRIAAYNAVWRSVGDSAHWWDGWCNWVALLYPKRFQDGAAVSALHRLPLEVSGAA